MPHPPRKLLVSWDLTRFARAEVRQDGQYYLYVRGTRQCIRTWRQVKEIVLTIRPCLRCAAYFKALKRLPRRDLYREAVFSCSTPFWIALSSADTVLL